MSLRAAGRGGGADGEEETLRLLLSSNMEAKRE